MKGEVDRAKISKIVLAIDVSQNFKTVMEKTVLLASAFSSDVYLLSVVKMPRLAAAEGDVSMSDIKNEEDEFSKHHRLLIDKCFTGSSMLVESVILHGDPASKICNFAESVGADLIIVKGKKESGFKRIFFGTVSQAVSNKASCSVLIVRERKKVTDEKKSRGIPRRELSKNGNKADKSISRIFSIFQFSTSIKNLILLH